MALKKSKLSQIPQRNKDLAFGFVRERQKINRISNVPEMIKYLCLIYFNPNKDEFDPDQCDEKIEINGNSIIGSAEEKPTQTVYLKNIASSGVHVWKFGFTGDLLHIYYNHPDLIGIFNMDYKHFSGSTNGYFDDYYDKELNENTSLGYGFTSDGRLTDDQDSSGWGKKYGAQWKKDDTIEMRLDFNKQNLKFKVNDNDYGIAFEIDANKKFKAAITIAPRQNGRCKIDLISYQKIY